MFMQMISCHVCVCVCVKEESNVHWIDHLAFVMLSGTHTHVFLTHPRVFDTPP